jgi:hypothetical protein
VFEDGELNPMYTMMNCLYCSQLIEFGDSSCENCDWEPSDDFWDKARNGECLVIQSPDHYPWTIDQAYDLTQQKFYDSGLKGCTDCIFFGTNLCEPLMDWLGESIVPDTPLNLDSIQPCNSLITSTNNS